MYCPYCGKKLFKDDYKFCPYCGKEISSIFNKETITIKAKDNTTVNSLEKRDGNASREKMYDSLSSKDRSFIDNLFAKLKTISHNLLTMEKKTYLVSFVFNKDKDSKDYGLLIYFTYTDNILNMLYRYHPNKNEKVNKIAINSVNAFDKAFSIANKILTNRYEEVVLKKPSQKSLMPKENDIEQKTSSVPNSIFFPNKEMQYIKSFYSMIIKKTQLDFKVYYKENCIGFFLKEDTNDNSKCLWFYFTYINCKLFFAYRECPVKTFKKEQFEVDTNDSYDYLVNKCLIFIDKRINRYPLSENSKHVPKTSHEDVFVPNKYRNEIFNGDPYGDRITQEENNPYKY